jgi:hypothetical protein
MSDNSRTSAVIFGLVVVFCTLAIIFAKPSSSHPEASQSIPLVDPQFTATTTIRTSYVQLIRMKADLSDFDCYGCHEKGKPPVLRFDTNLNLVIPQEHADLAMSHGKHNRNNNCFNCHDEHNLELLQTRDGREVKLQESPPLCGSCHGPTYRDWEAGAHGRTGGYWKLSADEPDHKSIRLICVDCHNPHHPKIPSRAPAPPPHPLRPAPQVMAHSEH